MKLFNRLAIYILGIFCIALGSVVAIKSRLGVSPVSSLPFSINMVSGISIGLVSVILFCIYVLVQILLLKKDFKKVQLLQVVFAIVFGQAVDLLNNTINLDLNNFVTQLFLCFASVVIIAFGIVMTLKADIVPLAPEGLSKSISTKYNIEFGKVKMRFDCIVVFTSVLLLLVSKKDIEGIGIGTIISAIMVGKVVQIINRIISRGEIGSRNIHNVEELAYVEVELDNKKLDFRDA